MKPALFGQIISKYCLFYVHKLLHFKSRQSQASLILFTCDKRNFCQPTLNTDRQFRIYRCIPFVYSMFDLHRKSTMKLSSHKIGSVCKNMVCLIQNWSSNYIIYIKHKKLIEILCLKTIKVHKWDSFMFCYKQSPKFCIGGDGNSG